MERDNFTCQICGDNESTLNVHHIKYERGKLPWEVSDEKLITTCGTCHKIIHEVKKQFPLIEKHNFEFKVFKLVDSKTCYSEFDSFFCIYNQNLIYIKISDDYGVEKIDVDFCAEFYCLENISKFIYPYKWH